MTTTQDDLNRAVPDPNLPAAEEYRIGPGKPPIEHRFPKGKSGNPGGKRKVRPCDEVLPQLPAGSLREMLMLETQRLVRVKVGDRWIEMPMIQAAFRAVGMRAARGDRQAMTSFARLMLQSGALPTAPDPQQPAAAEPAGDAHAHAPATPVDAAEEYKTVWTKVLSAAAESDLHIAAPVPHPDDVTVGQVRGTAHWPGSQPDEMLSLDALAATHTAMQETLPRHRPDIEAMEEGYEKAEAWCQWFALHDAMALIRLHLPQRYAGQIGDIEPSDAERLRDHSLRWMAAFDRDRFLKEREAACADAESEAARAIEDPAAAAEAVVYCDAWREVLAAQAEMQFARYRPAPHPDAVIIDAATGRVTYAAPVAEGGRATLANLRGTLAEMEAQVRQYEADERWARMASTEHFVKIAERKRGEVVVLSGVIGRWLAGVEDAG